jgi:hypothetical protein
MGAFTGTEAQLQDTLPELLARHIEQLKSLRGAQPLTIIAAVNAAAAPIEARIAQSGGEMTEAERAVLGAAQRLSFNAAADGWPGWEEGQRRSREDLQRGLDLAHRSFDLVQRLGLGPAREGTANWMIGAYHIALGDTDAALASLSVAVSHYRSASAPGPVLLTQGYIAIAYEAAGRIQPDDVMGFGDVLAAIRSGGFEDAAFFCAQLAVARRVFAGAGAAASGAAGHQC